MSIKKVTGKSGKSKRSAKPGAKRAPFSSAAVLLAAGVATQEAFAALRPDQQAAAIRSVELASDLDALLQDGEALGTDQVAASGENLEALADEELPAEGEPLQVADASGALGIRTDEAFELAQNTVAKPAAQSAAQPAAQGGAAAGGAEAGAAAGGAEAGAAAAGGAEAAGAAGLAAAGPTPILAAGVGLAAAAGGGGAAAAGVAAAAAAPATVGGFAAKGPLNGATVFLDANGNGKLDTGEASTTTGTDGKYSFTQTQIDAAPGAKIIVQGGTYTDATGHDVAFNGKLVAPAGEENITVFSTLKAAGVSDSLLSTMLGGKTLDDLTSDDFSGTTGFEEASLKIFELIDSLTAPGDSADKVESIARTIGAVLQEIADQGGDLSNPGAIASAVELAQDSAIDAAAAFDALAGADGVITDAEEDALEAQVDADLDAFIAANARDIQRIDYASQVGATAEFDANGVFQRYRITETALLEDLVGNGDYFGSGQAGALAGQLYVDVEGTLLGGASNPITFSQLSALGVDKVVADDLAPYLRIRGGQADIAHNLVDNADGSPPFSIDAANTDHGLVYGTILGDEVTNLGGLGTETSDGTMASYLGSAGWNDPENDLDDKDV